MFENHLSRFFTERTTKKQKKREEEEEMRELIKKLTFLYKVSFSEIDKSERGRFNDSKIRK